MGESVTAVGNPFGLNQTITSGIVSAIGRANVGIADYEDFIQTDAAINPGNSGGALINIKGEVIGINTAIFSTSGGYMGIGFAIPSNMAKMVMDSLIQKGKVVRGWMGISIQTVTPELGKQFGLSNEKGALVGEVIENSPAEKAEIKSGDVIVEYDGNEVTDPTSLRNAVAVTSPGKIVTIKVIRDKKPLTFKVAISEEPGTAQQSMEAVDNMLKGVQIQNLTPELKKRMGIPARVGGVVVADVTENSPAEGTMMKGDIIMQVNGTDIGNAKEYETVVLGIKTAEGIRLKIYRNGVVGYVALSPK